MAKQVFYINDPKVRRGWKFVQRIDHKGVYDILDSDPVDNDDDDNFANQLLKTSTETDSITTDLENLPRYNPPEAAANDVEVPKI
ncbi:hypothetical protein ACFX15_008901 [Malus domestica]